MVSSNVTDVLRGRLAQVENNSSRLSEIVDSERDTMNELKQRIHAQEGMSHTLKNEVRTQVILLLECVPVDLVTPDLAHEILLGTFISTYNLIVLP